MLHFPLCREFGFDMVFCSGIRLAPYAVLFSTRNYLQHIAIPVESDRPINIVFVRPFDKKYYHLFERNKMENMVVHSKQRHG